MTAPDPTARFAELVARPEAEVAPGEAALLVAAHAHPGLDVDAALGDLDALAGGVPGPGRVDAAALARHLFVDEGFRGNRDDYGDPRNSYLDDVLHRRLGIPITLTVVMIEVGRRLGLDVEGVGMPGHFLAGARDQAGAARWFDPFDGGEELSVAGCRERFARLHPGVAFDDSYLAPVGARAIVTRMLANLEQTLLARDPASVVWVTRLQLLVPGLTARARRALAARLGSLGAYSDAADVLDALARDAADDPGAGGAPARDEIAARALRARGN